VKLRAGDVTYEVEAASGPMRVTELRPFVFEVAEGGRRDVVRCVVDGARVHVFADGDVHVLERVAEGASAGPRAAGGALEAPMPGKVAAVRVAEGDEVRRGQELVVVEAMKMENALRAPRDGRVVRVRVRVGEMVNPGVPLVELE
jgi:3-methylcrotonyl-CoA carboxylase alpha subunit